MRNIPQYILEHAVYCVGIAILIRIVIFFADYHPPTIIEEIKLDLIIILLSSLFVLLHLLFQLKGPISSLIKIDTIIPKKFRNPFQKFIESNLDYHYHVLLDAQSKEGATLDVNSVTTLVHICFELGEGKYDGTTINVPSEYYKLYPKYLDAHKKNLNSKKCTPGSRILIVKKSDLINDFIDNYEKVLEFVSWHIENHVTLKVVEPSEAENISKAYGIPDNITDIGIWHDKYVLLFKPAEDGKIKLYMKFDGEEDYINTRNYFSELDKKASKIDLVSIQRNGLAKTIEKRELMKTSEKLFGYRLALEWDDFVDCEKRLDEKGKEVRFLNMLIEKYKKSENFVIFDAALGTGCESIYFLKKGIRVISNEINPTFQIVAYQKAENEKVKLEINSWNWLEFDKKFAEKYGNLKVDMVLLLGNSICLLTNKNDIIKGLSNIKSILKPGGILVVDERNFEYILKDAENILKDPIKNFRYKGEVIYCGDKVKGVPTYIDTNVVRFTYYKVPPSSLESIKSWEILKPGSEYFIGTLDKYPFRMNELEGYLRKAGFVNITRYSDFEEGYNENADFYIYVAQVPTM